MWRSSVLRYFLAVAREGNITSAANYLHLTSPLCPGRSGTWKRNWATTFDKKKPPGHMTPRRDAISQAGGGDRLHGG